MPDYKFGLLPNDPNKPRIHFEDVFSGITPDHPPEINYFYPTGWKMLGNDQWGDCVAVGCANAVRHVTTALSTEYYPTQAEVFKLYSTQNGGLNSNGQPRQDGGMVIQDALSYWNKNVWGGRKLVAFAQVNFHDLELLRAAIAIFGGVLIGTEVRRANQQQFDAGLPWDYVRTSPVVGGHLVIAGGYTAGSDGRVIMETWAKLTSFTQACILNQWSECWIPIFPEHLGTKSFQTGVNGKKLADAYMQLTGKAIDIPDPTPNPTPTPVPVPVPTGKQVYMISGDNITITKISG